MPTPYPCYLPDCVSVAGATPLLDLGGYVPAVSEFGPGFGTGGIPLGFRGFQAPPGKVPQHPQPKGPIFTPKPPERAAPLPAPPAKPPAPPPPPTPVGEPPIDEPPYSSYDPNAFDQYQYKPNALERFFAKLFPGGIDYMLLSKILSGAGDFINLLTYTADLGPSATEEAARVSATLQPLAPGGLPYADPVRTLGEQLANIPAPDIAGLSDLGGDTSPMLAPVTVSASRPRPASAALALPSLDPLSATLQPGGVALPQAAVRPLVSSLAAPVTSPIGRTLPSTRPRVSARPGLARPELALTPGQVPGQVPGLAYNQSPLEGTQPGEKPSNQDCQQTGTKQKQKKQRKKRNVCYRGTYEERANGLLKWRKERIQCR